MKKERYYYKKFLDIDKLKSLKDMIVHKYLIYLNVISFTCLFPPIITTFTGYNLHDTFSLILFILYFIIFIVNFILSIKLILLERTNKILKNKFMIYIYTCFYFFLSLIFTILPIWTTTSIITSKEIVETEINPIFFITIYIPLYIGFTIFFSHAFTYAISDYSKFLIKKKKDHGDDNTTSYM